MNFDSWLEASLPDLKPPVCNKMLFGTGQLKIQVVGGPNQREDYHIEDGAELFYQMRGDMAVDVIEHGRRRRVPIREGEIFLLPGRIPHSPQRWPDTVGIVAERERLSTETDGLRWYVPGEEGSRVLYEEWFHCLDLGTELKPVIQRFFASEAYRTKEPPREFAPTEAKVRIDMERTVPEPVHLERWIAEGGHHGLVDLFGNADSPPDEFHVQVAIGADPSDSWTRRTVRGEVFFHQLKGTLALQLHPAEGDEITVEVGPGSVYLAPIGTAITARWSDDALGLVVRNAIVEE